MKLLADNDKFSLNLFNKLVGKAFDSFNVNEQFDLKFDYEQIGICYFWWCWWNFQVLLFIYIFILKENETNKIDLKDATVTLYTLIAELAKHDVDSSTVGTLLEDYGFGSDKINSFKENYEVLVQFFVNN